MPRVSRNPLEPEIHNEINKAFIDLLASFGSKAELKKFVSEFLTKEEKTMLAKRLALYVAVAKGYDYREINRSLKFSFETIRKAKEVVLLKSDGFKLVLENLIKAKAPIKTNRLFKFIELAVTAKSDIKSRAKLSSGDY
jgi:uncharacterized protein YerC